jgi:hypothetical protein
LIVTLAILLSGFTWALSSPRHNVYTNVKYGFELVYPQRYSLDPWENDHTFTLHNDDTSSIFFFVENSNGLGFNDYIDRHTPLASSAIRQDRSFQHVSGTMITVGDGKTGVAKEYFYVVKNNDIFSFMTNGDWTAFESILNSFQFVTPLEATPQA